jgi:cysteinyl-tRNA synthetase
LYNTFGRSLSEFTPDDPARVTFYTCGPTVYDDAHIGNFRSFLAADVLRRWIESPLCVVRTNDGRTHAGPRTVVHVMNITDVGHMTDDAGGGEGGEDRMAVGGRRIAEAKKAGSIPADARVDPNDPRAIAAFFGERFGEDARRLGLKVAIEAQHDPTLMPRASDHIDGMIAMIARLIDRGCAYVRGEQGSRAVYFDVQAFERYGELSGNTLDALRGGAGGRVSDAAQAEKKHPADFLLWKEDAAHLMKWPSPWGTGYPGWHIECSVMALGRLSPRGLAGALRGDGPTIDLHSGGEDNLFPHHECEHAQSCCATGADRFSRHWLHVRFLMVDGKKMSKSAGTFYTPRQLFAQGHEPAAVRLELIKTHYRANADFSMQGLKDSARMVERWRKFAEAGEAGGGDPAAVPAEAAAAREAFAAAMASDLNVAGAIGAVNQWIGRVARPTAADAAVLREFDGVLGVLGLERPAATATAIGVYLPGTEPSERVEALLAERAAAKKAKDFARADAIRAELAGLGLAIKDVAGGKVEVGPA